MEEHANTISHGVGALLGVTALIVLVVLASVGGDPWSIVSMSVYGASLVLLFGASTAYHAARSPQWKRMLRIVDHSSIFLLIAGTYTPFTLIPLRGPWGYTLFGVVWGLGIVGVLGKLVWTGRFEYLSLGLYLAMGWVGVIAAVPLLASVPLQTVGWLIAGGLAYTGGVFFYAWTSLRFHHLAWHLAVLLGAACHFLAVLSLVTP